MEDGMTITYTLSRRSIITAVATIGAAAAVPALAEQAPAIAADAIDRAGMVARAEQIVDLLSNRYIRKGWNEAFDHQRAAQFVESVRRFDPSDGECEHFTSMLKWMSDHGQSLDWLATGDADSFITGAAAASPDKAGDPIFAAIEAHRRAWSDLDPCSDLDEAASSGDKEAERELNRLHAALSDAEDNLLDIPPTTIAGAAAVLAYAAHHVSGGGGISWPNGKAWMSRRGVEWEVILHRNLAKALQAMAVRS
jgi:hypothetical protein